MATDPVIRILWGKQKNDYSDGPFLSFNSPFALNFSRQFSPFPFRLTFTIANLLILGFAFKKIFILFVDLF
jgi:hypothetical protein